ncbi:MAG: hypothetical protein IPK82_34500 [Polyangiaceae bacterium]|nr:hypothetical protein [Polyangiaceae bacterium]
MQNALEAEFLRVFELEHRKQYDEALAFLDAIWETNRTRDHDGWLARNVAQDRAVILLHAGRYPDAERAYRAWAELGFEDVSQHWMHADGMARTLEALGRDQEALAVIEHALGHQDPRYLPSALWILTEFVRLSEKVQQPVDPKWLRVAEAIAERYGLDMPARESAAEAIRALEEATHGKQPRQPRT